MLRNLAFAVVPVSLACAGGPAFDTTLELSSDRPSARHDRDVILARAASMGTPLDIEVLDDNRLRLSMVRHTKSTLNALLIPGRFEIVFPDTTLRNEQVDTATLQANSAARRHSVMVELSPAGSRQFCEASAAHVGNPVPIRLDGAVLMAPVIREAICGGTVQISVQSLDQARGLAGALSSAVLDGSWTVMHESDGTGPR